MGLSQEQVKGVLALSSEAAEQLKKELEVCKSALAEFRSLDVEGLRQEAMQWKEKALETEKLAQEQAECEVLRREAEKLYCASGVKNSELLDVLVDWEKVRLDDGAVTGLKEQIDALKERYGYLFDNGVVLPSFSAAVANGSEGGAKSVLRKALGI